MSQLRSALMRNPRIFALLFSLAAILLIVACDRAGEKGNASTRIVDVRTDTVFVRDTTVVVDTVVVEKLIVKKTEVPAEIPELYVLAWKRLVAESGAGFADEKMCFSGLDSIEVSVSMSEAAEDILSKRRAKDKFELTLRRNGVPLSDRSNPYLLLGIDVFWNDSNTIAIFHIQAALTERVYIYRNRKPYRRLVPVWETGSYGSVGRNLARESFLNSIEEKAERVANLYLSAN